MLVYLEPVQQFSDSSPVSLHVLENPRKILVLGGKTKPRTEVQ